MGRIEIYLTLWLRVAAYMTRIYNYSGRRQQLKNLGCWLVRLAAYCDVNVEHILGGLLKGYLVSCIGRILSGAPRCQAQMLIPSMYSICKFFNRRIGRPKILDTPNSWNTCRLYTYIRAATL